MFDRADEQLAALLRVVAPAAAPADGALFAHTDFMSADGMQTAIFGPAFWFTIHLVSFNYPVDVPIDGRAEVRSKYRSWLWSLASVLPCRYCRDNFGPNVEQTLARMRALYPSLSASDDEFYLQDRDTFSRFCYHLHETVNTMLDKPTPMSFEQVRERYEGMRSRCLTKDEELAARERGEAGCTQPLYAAAKGKCVIHIVPREVQCDSLKIAEECQIHRRQ